MADQAERSIDAARRSFNRELLSADYPRIHGDEDQVGRLVGYVAPRPGARYLDLATGNGIMAFAVAGAEPRARVIGIDIAERAISRNRAEAKAQGRANIEFFPSDGRVIDFADATFDAVACRYAWHHFPDAEASLAEIQRVLKPAGALVIADAVMHPGDDADFVNRFQALKRDGHVRMRSADALIEFFHAHGFAADGRFASEISFHRDLDPAHRQLIDATPTEILDLYRVKPAAERAAITFDVVNVRLVPSSG